jgi:hypothetical protein
MRGEEHLLEVLGVGVMRGEEHLLEVLGVGVFSLMAWGVGEVKGSSGRSLQVGRSLTLIPAGVTIYGSLFILLNFF